MLISITNKIKRLEQALNSVPDVPPAIKMYYDTIGIPRVEEQYEQEEIKKAIAKSAAEIAAKMHISLRRAHIILKKIKPEFMMGFDMDRI